MAGRRRGRAARGEARTRGAARASARVSPLLGASLPQKSLCGFAQLEPSSVPRAPPVPPIALPQSLRTEQAPGSLHAME